MLLIHHYGGTAWIWSTTDKYRLEDGRFRLIGFTHTYGQHCTEFTLCDFNLLTGKIHFEKEFESCANENEPPKVFKKQSDDLKKRVKRKIYLEDRSDAGIEIRSRKCGVTVNL